MKRRSLILLSLITGTLVVPLTSRAEPFQQNPMGPISDVTKDWQHYQPAASFCVKPDVSEYTYGGVGATSTGELPACHRSGFQLCPR